MVSQLEDINIKTALQLYAKNNGVDLRGSDPFKLDPTLGQVGYTSLDGVAWLHPTLPKPDAATLITLYDEWFETESAKFDSLDTVKSAIKSTAQSSVGIQLTSLTANHQKALLAILLYKVGAINTADMTINPLNEWVR